MIVKDTRQIFAAMAADRAIMRIIKQVDSTSDKIKRAQKIERRKSGSKDPWHFDPMEGRRFANDESGWLIGAVMVVAICGAMVLAHTYDFWGM